MITIKTNIYTFEELTEEQKEKAIDSVRNKYYDHNDFAEWAIDDCSLFEPPQKELEELFGKDYKFPLLENTREKLFFSLGRDRYIDISNAMQISDDTYFLKWLGINKYDFLNDDGCPVLDYKIGKDTIEFYTNDFNVEFTNEQETILEKAKEKFEEHCENILNRIEYDIDYRFTDEAIIEDIHANDYQFTEQGNLY